MGTKNPDLVSAPPCPLAALTVGEMIAARWHVLGVCDACRLELWADLRAIAALVGHDALFWGRSTRCRRYKWGDDQRCTGRVTFKARSIRSGSWTGLAFTDEVRLLWLQRQHPGQDLEQMAFDAVRRSSG